MKLDDFGRKVETGILITLAVALSALFYVKCWPKEDSSVIVTGESETIANIDDDSNSVEVSAEDFTINDDTEDSESGTESVENPEILPDSTLNSSSTSVGASGSEDTFGSRQEPQVESSPSQSSDKENTSSVTQSSAEHIEPSSISEAPEETGLININTATSAQLQTLTGIGEVKAQAIIDYREACGAFSRIEEITEVSGIGEKTFEKIRDRITV